MERFALFTAAPSSSEPLAPSSRDRQEFVRKHGCAATSSEQRRQLEGFQWAIRTKNNWLSRNLRSNWWSCFPVDATLHSSHVSWHNRISRSISYCATTACRLAAVSLT